MANIAELQASIKIKADEAQRTVDMLNKRIEQLNKNFKENGQWTSKENAEFNRLSGTVRKSEKDLERYNKQLDKLNKSSSESTGIWSKLATRITVAGIAVQAITESFRILTSTLTQSAKEVINFQKNMSLVNTVFRMSKQDINDYSKQVAGLGTKLGKAPSELAMGLYELSQAGIEAKDGMSTLELATKASVAGFTDVQTAVKSGIGMMNAYGLSTKDLNSIYDLQFKIVERGILSYEDLQEALGNTMSSAVQAKVPMNELGGQLAYLTKQGQNSSKASVALARAYESIFSKSDKFKKLGIDVADSNGKLRSTTDILGELAKVMDGYTEKAQFDIMAQLGFSERADRAIIAMMGNVQGVRDEIAKVTDNVGSMSSAFEKAQDNISTQWNKLKSDVFEKTTKAILDNEGAIISLIKTLGNLLAIVEGLAGYFKNIGKLFAFPELKQLTTAFENITSYFANLRGEFTNVQVDALDTSKAFETFSEEAKKSFEKVSDSSFDMTKNVGTDLDKMLSFYKNFTKDLSLEVKKQVAVTAGLGTARSYIEQMKQEEIKSGKSFTKDQWTNIYKKAGILGQTTYETVGATIGINSGTSSTSDYNYKKREAPNLNGDDKKDKSKQEIKLDLLDIENWAIGVVNDIEESWKSLDEFVSNKDIMSNLDIESWSLNVTNDIEESWKDLDEFVVKKTDRVNENLNATADLFGELGYVLENDFLNSMANTINGITSIMNTMKSINAGSIGGFAGGLGIATAAIGILSPIVSTWFGNSDSENKRNEASQKFEEAVNKFQQAVDSMSLGQKISFAKLTKPTNLAAGAITEGGTNLFKWGANNATIDTTAIENALSSGGYSGIDVQAIFKKYAQYKSYIDSSDWFKRKSYISGYDTAGAMAEINRLIEEAYQKNLENFKEALNLTTSSFASALSSALDGGDVESILTDMFNNAMKTAFLNQEMFESVYKAIGTSMSDLVLQAMGGKGKTADELKNMSLTDLVAYLKEMMSTWTDVQKKAFEEAGLSLDNLTKAVDKTTSSMSNLPSYVKTVQLENLATQGYNVGRGNSTYINVETVVGSLDSSVVNLITKATKYNVGNRTGNY